MTVHYRGCYGVTADAISVSIWPGRAIIERAGWLADRWLADPAAVAQVTFA